MVSTPQLLRPKNLFRTAPQLDVRQQDVVDQAPGHGPMLVLGGPGSGKTTAAVEYAVAKIKAGVPTSQVLLLTNTRTAASQLRNQLTARLNFEAIDSRSETPVRSFASYAFDLITRIREDHVATPRLLAGAEQDRVIAELIEGYMTDPELALEWPESLAQAVGLRGLRHELRELIDRSAEYGIQPGQLEALGRSKGRAEWRLAATILQDYRDVLDLSGDDAYDASGLITSAADLWEANPNFAADETQRIQHIIIDDFQDATPAIHRLVKLIGTQRDIVITANPDTTVQGFRGARPQALAQWPQILAPDATVTTLDAGYRMGEQLNAAYQRTVGRIPAVAGFPDIRARLTSATHDDSVAVHRLASPVQEHLFILQQVLELHHREGVAFDDMAVLARTASKVSEVATALESEAIPVARSISEVMLNQQPAAAPLLVLTSAADAVARGSGETATGLEPADLHWLITGRYGASTPLELRNLRRRLLSVERDEKGTRASAELLDELVANPNEAASLLALDADRPMPRYARGAVRIGRMLAAMTTATVEEKASAEMVLWAGWATALPEVGNVWEEQALGDDKDAAVRANRDLDSAVALFEAAERYVVQFPGQSAAGFTEYLAEQDLPMDSLSSRSDQTGVAVLTPTSAAGGSWNTVFVVGVQEGVWPNTRLRGQLLHTQELVEEVTGTAGDQPINERIAQVRHDELRTFAAAISRASQRLIATAVADADHQPSMFIERLDPWPPTDDHPVRPYTTVATPLTVSGLVIDLRRTLEEAQRTLSTTTDPHKVELLEAGATQAAEGLAVLAEGGISTASPDNWWGLLELSTQTPIHGIDETGAANRIRLSPSTVETAVESPLRWFIYQVSTSASSPAAATGTFVHAIAEKYPQADVGEMYAELKAKFPVLAAEAGIEPGWEYDALYAKAQRALEFFYEYVSGMSAGYTTGRGQTKEEFGPRTLVAVEQRVSVDLTVDDLPVQLNGVIDRVEVDHTGRPYVVDLKTGSTNVSGESMLRLPQLGVYQAMVKAGALTDIVERTDPAGAALVQLGKNRASVQIQPQAPLGAERSWAEDDIADAARWVQGPYFYNVHQGEDCNLAALCPICTEGQQVTEWLV
ncbi:MAG: ATP-dependent helicase [Micrococcaceae bacterium]|nr:ATP-dependent helicase [Micrococcaceae bacterium]